MPPGAIEYLGRSIFRLTEGGSCRRKRWPISRRGRRYAIEPGQLGSLRWSGEVRGGTPATSSCLSGVECPEPGSDNGDPVGPE